MRPTGKAYDLPTPRIAIGAKVVGFKLDDYSRYMWARFQLREFGRTAKRLRFLGYCKREPGETIIVPRWKEIIREVFTVVDSAYEIEVAGIQASGLHLQGHPTNACYVGGGSGWSGMDFSYQLLFRAKRGKNHVVVLQPSDLRLFYEYHLLKHINH
ncbi:hypothetical protein QA639_21265 [Bradyrhizobium pachyrhizi]|uniref:hypothetical protein n=1 Tax=Bradyrhizobium pachyrhizi TaxID=280333 RepID=UPI0024B22FC9|nr:hypothetical protein [Bradyrhizobium pachyrhizi]WFU52240.1 hypothetical protein QA639_21265 [Bradyrhizobium pachyrhizi]